MSGPRCTVASTGPDCCPALRDFWYLTSQMSVLQSVWPSRFSPAVRFRFSAAQSAVSSCFHLNSRRDPALEQGRWLLPGGVMLLSWSGSADIFRINRCPHPLPANRRHHRPAIPAKLRSRVLHEPRSGTAPRNAAADARHCQGSPGGFRTRSGIGQMRQIFIERAQIVVAHAADHLPRHLLADFVSVGIDAGAHDGEKLFELPFLDEMQVGSERR